ncbi:MAG: sugar phosphate isomerase/epimerase [Armatimonadetes bacterium]|nr:sugar phosphate isomerase/epimerase [Armatimonadota bacterium]
MRIGFLTNCFRDTALSEITDWAVAEGFDFLEIGGATRVTEQELADAADGIPLIAMTFCRNCLDQDPRRRNAILAGIQWRIEVAGRLGIPFVTTATGYDPSQSLQWNLTAAAAQFGCWLKLAAALGVTICIENCPGTGNFGVTPHTWQLFFDACGTDNLKLCYDPSHLVKLLVDVYQAAREFAPRIGYVHVKDCALIHEVLAREGMWGNDRYWQHRIPGDGEIDWPRLLGIMREAGFDGDLSIEHEDPRYEQSITQVKEALLRSRDVIVAALQ